MTDLLLEDCSQNDDMAEILSANAAGEKVRNILAGMPRDQILGHLAKMMSRIPGLGPRSGERAMVRMITHSPNDMARLGAMLIAASLTAKPCTVCGHVDTIDPCHICRDPKRSESLLLIVSQSSDVWSLEKTQTKYRYHVLGGCLDALSGIGPEHLKIPDLIQRIATQPAITEIVLALPASLEGATTSYHVHESIRHLGRRVTRLGIGMPVGADISTLDEGTIGMAIKERRAII